jgi:MFS superfamily sulfate permease-like transporter
VAGSILLGRRFAPRLPVSLVAVVGTIAASARFHFAERGIAVIGPVPGGLPSIKLPDASWSETLALLPVAASCFVMIIAQSAATSRVYAASLSSWPSAEKLAIVARVRRPGFAGRVQNG